MEQRAGVAFAEENVERVQRWGRADRTILVVKWISARGRNDSGSWVAADYAIDDIQPASASKGLLRFCTNVSARTDELPMRSMNLAASHSSLLPPSSA